MEMFSITNSTLESSIILLMPLLLFCGIRIRKPMTSGVFRLHNLCHEAKLNHILVEECNETRKKEDPQPCIVARSHQSNCKESTAQK